jgi:hypothetical protein
VDLFGPFLLVAGLAYFVVLLVFGLILNHRVTHGQR